MKKEEISLPECDHTEHATNIQWNLRYIHAKLKFLFAYHSTLCNEGTLESCHLRLVLSTSLIALALVAVNINILLNKKQY